jgi:hypothetical protein
MSRLPEHANLEHLKKQAKALLPELQRQNPKAKLADALHAVARQYGFSTWPSLKEHLADGSAGETATENPFAGVWRANIQQSKRHPAYPFESATVKIAVSGAVYTISQQVIEPSGQPQRSTSVIHVDGEERPPEASGFCVVAKRIAARVIEVTATKDGLVVGRGSYEVSRDGTSLTVSTKNAGANADGWQSEFDQIIRFDRVTL